MRRKMLVVRSVVAAIVVAIAAVGFVAPVHAKHEMWVNMHAVLFGFPLVREIPTGTWAIVTWGWYCMKEEQVVEFMQSIDYTLTIDGETVECEVVYEPFMGYPAVWFDFYWHPRPPGEYYAYLDLVFTENHFDGWDWYLEGTEMDGERIILVTPRDLYPQDPPEEEF